MTPAEVKKAVLKDLASLSDFLGNQNIKLKRANTNTKMHVIYTLLFLSLCLYRIQKVFP